MGKSRVNGIEHEYVNISILGQQTRTPEFASECCIDELKLALI